MTRKEAIKVFLNRGWIKVEGGTYFDGDKWREAIMVISDYFQKEYKASEQEPEWIPVSERLPEDGEEVLCFLQSEEMAVLFRRNNWGQYEWVDGGFATGSYDVIAWMPLPQPYRAESEVQE